MRMTERTFQEEQRDAKDEHEFSQYNDREYFLLLLAYEPWTVSVELARQRIVPVNVKQYELRMSIIRQHNHQALSSSSEVWLSTEKVKCLIVNVTT